MNTEILRPLTTVEVDTYHRDGVLLLKNMFDKDWIELLNKGLDLNCKDKVKVSGSQWSLIDVFQVLVLIAIFVP